MNGDGRASAAARTLTVARGAACELVVTRRFDAPVEAVFAAWTQADLFRRWWAPQSMGVALSACAIDARTGGGYRITFGEGAESATFFGRYLEVTPPRRLVWTNDEDGAAPRTTVTFEDDAGRTKLIYRDLYPSAEPLDEAAAGAETMMAEQFLQLDALLASQARPG